MKPAAVLFRRGIAALESVAPRAVWMVIPCVVGLSLWRALPDGSLWAPPVYAAGGLIVLLAMAAFRYRVPDAAFTIVAGLSLLSVFCAIQGEPQLARVMGGGVLVVLVTVALVADAEPMDKALSIGQGLTLLAWFAGNVSRGTFGPDVARSALGQAYGSGAEAGLWLAILAAYLAAWYNHKAKSHA